MAGKQDLRVVKTRDAIKTAFRQMICEMDANRITVKELAERARIHRQTFYLHYPSMDDLLDDVIRDILNKFLSLWSDSDTPFDHSEMHRRFFLQCAQLEEYEERIICHPSYADYCKKMFLAGMSYSQKRFNDYQQWPQDVQDMINHHVMSCFLEFYRQWVSSGKKMSVEELTFISDKLMYNGLSGFITTVPHPGGHI